MNRWVGIGIASISAVLYGPAALSATCSCAGVPLSSSDGFVATEAGEAQLSIDYNFHDISDLVAGSERINDETERDRASETVLVRYGYGLTDRWTLGALTSYVRHERQVGISNEANQVSTGMGDSLLSASYTPEKITVFNRQQLTYGLAIRIPTGEEDNGSPLFLEDMQPGQGAWGGTAWVYWARAYSQQARWKTFVSLSHSETGENSREYSFEGETNLSAGVSYSSDYGLALQGALEVREADAHTRFGGELPNTGGRWVNASFSAQYTMTPVLAIRTSMVVPVSRDLNGSLQFTTRRQWSLGMVYSFE